MKIESPVFEESASIPPAYTCDGDSSLSPPLAITGIPDGTHSLVLIVDDPDVPRALRQDGNFTHWVLFNIPPETLVIPEGATVGVVGRNTVGDAQYTGPCPPPEYEPTTHRYVFKLYALDTMLELETGAAKGDVEMAMDGHVLATAQLIGTYSRV